MTAALALALLLALQTADAPAPAHARELTEAEPPKAVPTLPPRRRDPGRPPTRLTTELLRNEPLVVLTRTEGASVAGPGVAVVRVRVERQLYGPPVVPGQTLVVFAYPGHFQPGSRQLVYLEPFRGGQRYRPIQLVDARDPDWRGKLTVTEALLAVAAEPAAGRRDAATVDLLLAWLGHSEAWMRAFALGEWRWIAAQRPDVLTPSRLARLTAAGARSPDESVRRGVLSVAKAAAEQPSALPAPAQQESSRP